jgi:hypothetical protein
MDNPFYGLDNRRAITPEISDYIMKKTGSIPVYGFSEMLETGEAISGSERISGFRENHLHNEWLLPISAKSGMMWKTSVIPEHSLPKVSFVLSVGFGNGSPLPQPSGHWDIFVNDQFAVSIRVVNHSQMWKGQECIFTFSANRIETAEPFGSLYLSSLIKNESSAAFGPAFLTVPTSWVKVGEPTVIRIEPHCDVPSTRWIQIENPSNIFMGANIYSILEMIEKKPSVGEYNLYFGDIHTHSGQVMENCENKGCGMGTREENYQYAKTAGGLDFYALTDHEYQVAPEKKDEYLGLADKHNEDERFVCLPAFEYTNLLYGHRNVYFRGSGGTVFNTNKDWGPPTLDPDKCNTPDELWSALEKTGIPFITVPHHTSSTSHPLNLDFFNPKYDRLFEIYSCWGSSEYYGDFPRGVSDRYHIENARDAIQRGQRYGFIGSSDGHDGNPGNAQSPFVKHHHLFHFCGSGWAVVLAPELTREAVFDALYARRCYATTGVPIILNVTLNGAVMGSELQHYSSGIYPKLNVTCRGTNGIDHIRIVKNGVVVHTVFCHNEFSYNLEWEDSDYNRAIPNSYYVRIVQKDRESAWSSPIWIG